MSSGRSSSKKRSTRRSATWKLISFPYRKSAKVVFCLQESHYLLCPFRGRARYPHLALRGQCREYMPDGRPMRRTISTFQHQCERDTCSTDKHPGQGLEIRGVDLHGTQRVVKENVRA